jgi:D-xylose transport system substrate-binding protein
MASLRGLAAQGRGKIGVLLPETATSARYVSFDAPYLTKAMNEAGLTSSDYIITNAQGSDATELANAQAAITQGASVLIMDPHTSGVGGQIEAYAKSHGVKVIDYDRLTLGGTREFYVSFDNVHVGQLIGQGFVDCVGAWKVSKPHVLVMRGDPTDNNATLFAQGYDGVLQQKFSSGAYVKVGEPTGTWTPAVARATFEQQYTAHPDINSVVTPNDDNANAIITFLKSRSIKAKSFPTSGQDATLTGLQNILAGYQCGTVYKPIYLEAQAAVTLALYLRAGQTPPASLVNGQVTDTTAKTQVASVLLTPIWVTSQNMASTVVADQFVKTAMLCQGAYATLCKNNGIS